MMPEEEDCGLGLVVGEMARVADRFQASELNAHCVEQFREGLAVGNVLVRLVQARHLRLTRLKKAAMEYFKANPLAFQVRNHKNSVIVLCVFREIAVVRYWSAS